MTSKTKKNNLELIIRPHAAIKSRQWWTRQVTKFRKLLPRYLPQKKHKQIKALTFTLLITNNKEIQNLNKKFRRKNTPTDVLSFSPNKKEEQFYKGYLGDIIISFETAKKQATNEKIKTERELLKLLIHGYLHLIGYDHKINNDAKKMFLLQHKLLKELSNQK